MKEQLVSLEAAKFAKEVGFNILCFDYVDVHGEENSVMGFIGDNFEEKYEYAKEFIDYYLPTQSLLQRWLREVHNIRVFVTFETIDNSETAWIWNITKDNLEGKGRKKDTWDFYDTYNSFSKMSWFNIYEQALEVGLFEALRLIKL